VQLKAIFKQSPSLKQFAEEAVSEIYPDALGLASIKAGLDRKKFPLTRPYSFVQIMDADYLPEE
jgi:hypothetical protein